MGDSIVTDHPDARLGGCGQALGDDHSVVHVDIVWKLDGNGENRTADPSYKVVSANAFM